jgi:mRNA interferase RelE/StbE
LAYNGVYKGSVKRDLKGIGKDDARRLLDRIEKDLSKKPDAYPALKGEFAGLRKHRFADYRVVFAIVGSDVLILRFGHCKDVYRRS